MKHTITLGIALFANWLLWSGHFDNLFLIGLGVISCVASMLIATRMHIVDDEGAPEQLGLRPFLTYAPWLVKEIVISNIEVARIIMSRDMPLQRNMVRVKSSQSTALGRVILANSITLTPGTVSVKLEDDEILVHGLSIEETAEDMSGDMDARVTRLENSA